MSEHKTGNSNWTEDQKRAYRSMRERGMRGQGGFYFTTRGFSYLNGPTAHISKTTVTTKAFRKMTKRAVAYLSKQGAGR